MKRFFVLALCFALVGIIAYTAEVQTVPRWQAGEVVRSESGKDINEALGMKLDNIKPTIKTFGTIAASTSTVIPVNYSYVRITAAPSTAVGLSLAAGTDGQLLYIYNDSATSTSGIATITYGNMGSLFYASGSWHLLSDE